MPAFSRAIGSIVSPRNSTWSIDTGVTTLAAARHDVGRIETAAEPDFQQQHVRGMLGEEQKGGGRRHLEEGDGRAGVDPLAVLQRRGEVGLVHEATAARAPSRMRSWKRTRWGEV